MNTLGSSKDDNGAREKIMSAKQDINFLAMSKIQFQISIAIY